MRPDAEIDISKLLPDECTNSKSCKHQEMLANKSVLTQHGDICQTVNIKKYLCIKV